MSTQMRPLPERRSVQVAIVVLAAAAVYATSLKVPFLTWDDTYYVTLSGRTQHGGLAGFLNLWSLDDIWAGRFLEFFPLRDSLYWAVWQLFGRNPVAFHVASIIAHALASALVLALAYRLGFPQRIAFWGALLFAVHPIHVESVAWIATLKDPMFMSLMLGSLLFYVSYRERIQPRDYALALGCLVGALLVKSIAICTPLLFIAIERLSKSKTPWRLVLIRVAGPAAIAAIFAVQFVIVGRAANVITTLHGGSWVNHVFLSAWAFVRYVQQAFVPASFALHYCFRPVSGPTDLRLLLIIATLASAVALFAFARGRASLVALLIAWFFICLAPVANIIPFTALMADRYLYAPSAASCLAIAYLVSRLPGIARPLLLGSIAVVFAGVTLLRGVVWQSEASLWSEVVQNPACREDSLPATAVAFLKHAGFQKDPRSALLAYGTGIEHVGFRSLLPQDQCYYLASGSRAALASGERQRARGYAERATRTCPYLATSWASLASAMASVDPPAALDSASRAYRLAPHPGNQWQLGQARLAAGDPGGAEDVGAAVIRAPQRLCDSFDRWLAQLPSGQRGSLQQAQAVCASGTIAGRASPRGTED
jgi:hypothetical protein